MSDPIIIIGAARSGTKILRAALSSHPEMVAIPYDINYVWKYDNYDIDHDELSMRDLFPANREFIRPGRITGPFPFTSWQRTSLPFVQQSSIFLPGKGLSAN